MRSKKMVYWTFLIPAIVVVLIIIIVKLDTADNYISRAMASKAMALSLIHILPHGFSVEGIIISFYFSLFSR